MNNLLVKFGPYVGGFVVGFGVTTAIIKGIEKLVDMHKDKKRQEKIDAIIAEYDSRHPEENESTVVDVSDMTEEETSSAIQEAFNNGNIQTVIHQIDPTVDPKRAERFEVQFNLSQLIRKAQEEGVVLQVPVCEMTWGLDYWDMTPADVTLLAVNHFGEKTSSFIPIDWLSRTVQEQNLFLQYYLTIMPYDEIAMDLYAMTLCYRVFFGIDATMRDGLEFGITIPHPDTMSKEEQDAATLRLENPALNAAFGLVDETEEAAPTKSFLERSVSEIEADGIPVEDITSWDIETKPEHVNLRNRFKYQQIVFSVPEREICEDSFPQGWDPEDMTYRGVRYTQMLVEDGYYDEAGMQYTVVDFFFGKEMISHMYYPNLGLDATGEIDGHDYDHVTEDYDLVTTDGFPVRRTIFYRCQIPVYEVQEPQTEFRNPYRITLDEFNGPYGDYTKQMVEVYDDETTFVPAGDKTGIVWSHEELGEYTGYDWGDGYDDNDCVYMRNDRLHIDFLFHFNDMTYGEAYDWEHVNRTAESRLPQLNRAQRRALDREQRRKKK